MEHLPSFHRSVGILIVLELAFLIDVPVGAGLNYNLPDFTVYDTDSVYAVSFRAPELTSLVFVIVSFWYRYIYIFKSHFPIVSKLWI